MFRTALEIIKWKYSVKQMIRVRETRKIAYLELELATLLFERLRRLFNESPRLTTPFPVIEK